MRGGFDLSCLWAKWMVQPLPNRDPRIQSMVRRAMKIGINVVAYATGREPPQKLQKFDPIAKHGENDKLARGFLQVAKLKHSGDWDIAPRALRELLMGLNKAAGMTASTKKQELFANNKSLFKYPVAYMHGRSSFSISKAAKEQLKDYLKKRGGMLFADACCGSPEFNKSFRKLMSELFPDVKFKRIPVKHALFTQKTGFDLAKVKRRSPGSLVKESIVEPYLEGIEIDGRYVVVYSKYDISCALERQASTACAGYIRKDAMRIAINVLMYALLQDTRYSQWIHASNHKQK